MKQLIIKKNRDAILKKAKKQKKNDKERLRDNERDGKKNKMRWEEERKIGW